MSALSGTGSTVATTTTATDTRRVARLLFLLVVRGVDVFSERVPCFAPAPRPRAPENRLWNFIFEWTDQVLGVL
jgi:hypothetical protein